MKATIFALTNARSGTLYLRNLFRLNAVDCDCRHEVFFDWQNPTMFGRAIYDAYAGRFIRIRALLAKKRAYIERLPGSIYLESSHSFLKSVYVAAMEFFPNLKLVHLVRDPVKVAHSEAWRETQRRRFHAPFHFYRGDDGRRHFVWALTGNEEIFQNFSGQPLTLFQWYLIQWIEIENRAMNFLDEFALHDPLFHFGLAARFERRRESARTFRCFGRAHPATGNHLRRTQEPQFWLSRGRGRGDGGGV